MPTLDEKKEMILEKERAFADAVSARVIDKPTLSLWMILIPVIFVHFFYRLNRYAEGKKEFAKHFILTRERALNEAAASLDDARRADANKLAQAANIPDGTAKSYRAWMQVLLDHYRDLLTAGGDSYEDMVRRVYRNKTNYLLFLNSLGEAEKTFDRELKPHLGPESDGAGDIIRNIETCATDLRRQEAAAIFS